MLEKHNVQVIRAPYSALSQLEWLASEQHFFVHGIISSSDMLAYNVDRVITGIDFLVRTLIN